ncbi:MAG: hypothetical protein GXW96_07810 [Christensenellaceae bacterium]|nr:hypothetical protein [Christensenellaceae bacterium]
MTKNDRSRAKHKRWIYAILAALVVLMAQPLMAAAEGPGSKDTDVSAVVYPFYEFTLPPSATVTYPNTTVLVGQFGVNDLLLLEKETLAIELVRGVMRARGYAREVLAYDVTFEPPYLVDASHIGQSYDVSVAIDRDAFDGATRAFYDATLEFRVRSMLTGEVVWRGTTTVTAFKAQGDGQEGDEGGVVPPDTGDGGVVPPDTGDDTMPEEPVPQASPGTGQPEGGQPGVVIPAEEIPAAQPAWSGLWWWWIPVTALAALLLILLLVLWRRRRREEEQSG